jgi:hypothetical protein
MAMQASKGKGQGISPGLTALHIMAFHGQAHRKAIHVISQNNLARQAAMPRGTSGQINHIFFIFARAGQAGKPLCIDNDMAGRAGHLALARAFQREPCGLTNIEQRLAGFSQGLNVLAIGHLEADSNH